MAFLDSGSNKIGLLLELMKDLEQSKYQVCLLRVYGHPASLIE